MEIAGRFWAKVNKTSACWNWKTGKYSAGYGAFSLHGYNTRAHRFAWELAYGQIPEGLEVCHHCDNPACVRPDHLFLGTQKQNIRDGINKGRIIPRRCNPGESNGRAILAADQVQEIKRIYSHKGSKYSRQITYRKLAQQFNISRRTIADILKGRTWTL